MTRYTADEFAELAARADAASMTLGAFTRFRTIGSPGPRSRRRLSVDATAIHELISEISRIGNNLNQLTRMANMGDLEEPEELDPVLEKINDLADACMKQLGRDP